MIKKHRRSSFLCIFNLEKLYYYTSYLSECVKPCLRSLIFNPVGVYWLQNIALLKSGVKSVSRSSKAKHTNGNEQIIRSVMKVFQLFWACISRLLYSVAVLHLPQTFSNGFTMNLSYVILVMQFIKLQQYTCDPSAYKPENTHMILTHI